MFFYYEVIKELFWELVYSKTSTTTVAFEKKKKKKKKKHTQKCRFRSIDVE